MTLRLVHQSTVPASMSPYRLQDERGAEVTLANEFLDAQRIRGLAVRSLRAYGNSLLHFFRWWLDGPSRPISELSEPILRDYVRSQLDEDRGPTPQTVNHRLTVVRCLYRFHHGRDIPLGPSGAHPVRSRRNPFGFRRNYLATTLRLKQPRRVVVPLSPEDVSRFWNSFRTFRDLSIVALMLLNGLRSQEILNLLLGDLALSQRQIRVRGKGNRQRIMPLAEETADVLQCYLDLERPDVASPFVLVSLKGQRRGQPMTAAGLRSLFRHHRLRSQVPSANPHRLRHTFGSDMARAGVSLPALMHLMGHAHVHTTMLYVQISPQDVWREYARAVRARTRLTPPEIP